MVADLCIVVHWEDTDPPSSSHEDESEDGRSEDVR